MIHPALNKGANNYPLYCNFVGSFGKKLLETIYLILLIAILHFTMAPTLSGAILIEYAYF